MGIGSVTGIVSVGDPIWCGVRDELDALCRLAPALPVDVDVLVIATDPQQLAEAAEKIRHTQGKSASWGGRTSPMAASGDTAAMRSLTPIGPIPGVPIGSIGARDDDGLRLDDAWRVGGRTRHR